MITRLHTRWAATAALVLCAVAPAQTRTEYESVTSTWLGAAHRAIAYAQGYSRLHLQTDAQMLGVSKNAFLLDVYDRGSRVDYYMWLAGQFVKFGSVNRRQRHRVVLGSRNLFANDVSRTFYLTTGTYTVSGNVTVGANMNETFTPPTWAGFPWQIEGTLQGSANGTMRLVGSWLAGSIRYAAAYGNQGFSGRCTGVPTGIAGGLRYDRSAINLLLELGRPGFFTTAYTNLVRLSRSAIVISPFLIHNV